MENFLHLIEQYGYLLIFFGVMAESMGVPLPGETILISAGIVAQRGSLNLGDAILLGILGAVVGDQIGYWIGREGGRPFILRYGRYVLITPQRLERAEAFFARHGGKAVFMARFFSGLRVFGALVAGVSRMHWGTFIFYNALGGVAQDVVASDPLVRVDLAVLRFFRSHDEAYLTTSVNVLEVAFSPAVLLLVATLAGFAFLLLARRRGDFELGLSGAVLL